MEVPPEIAFRGVEPNEALKDRIQEGIEDLEEVYDRIVSCRVMVEDTTPARHSGKRYRVRLDVGIPNQSVVVDHRPPEAEGARDPQQAVKGAFDVARRRLKGLKTRPRKDIEGTIPPVNGRVADLLTDDGGVRYGFLQVPDGREIYFEEAALNGLSYDELEIGSEVRFETSLIPGEGGDPKANVIERA
ncbi:MAG: HPF/RaiA family ribosome-associated protein [Gemmatimonadota bacterium]